ncbi:Zonular occludens toxin (Zot) [compost metagenome]
MINLLLGQPGGGKSYESVAFHVIPAVVEQGRKVITNLPLRLDMWEHFFPGSTKLIEIRGNYQFDGKLHRPFSRVEDFGDPWRKDLGDGNELGPLYIIDECHKSFPFKGTPVAVEEWFAEHRHEGADVLLITQSYGKISAAIRDLVQVVYRCKKATAFGSNDRYVRKVQDGLRGEVVNTSIRVYESKYFPLYKSHTKSNGAVLEAMANDIVPLWKRWPFKGAAICLVLFLAIVGYQLFKGDKKALPPAPKAEPVQVVQQAQADLLPAAQPAQHVAQPRGPEQKLHPYQGLSMHLQALLKGKRTRDGNQQDFLGGYVTIAQNGQAIRRVSFDDLRTAGYEIAYESDTVISLTYKGVDVGFVVADLPTTGLASKVATAGVAN